MKYAYLWGILACLTACSSVPLRPARSELNPDFASRAVQLSLHCVDQEDPHWDEGQGKAPHAVKARHPAFFGCFDWHSAVHGHWAMLRVADALPSLPERSEIVKALGIHLSERNIRAELAHLEKNPGFEEPYGWGWFLRLVEELHLSKLPEAPKWKRACAPLEAKVTRLFLEYFRNTKTPNRVGTHNNTAFALRHVWDYARATGQEHLRKEVERAALRLYAADQNCPLASEPGPYDFISPCFVEADLLRRVLGPEEFRAWFAKFLPEIKPAQLRPVPPSNLQDYHQVHLVGLMYEKASEMEGVSESLAKSDSRRELLLEAAAGQTEMARKLMFDSGYGGTHWLASFAVYHDTGAGLGL